MHDRAGQAPRPDDLIDVEELVRAYSDIVPDPRNPVQRVVFGTSGHRGTALNGSFNEAHIAAISGKVKVKCTQTGGWTVNSNAMNRTMPTTPTADITKKAGPSAGSAKL